MAQYEFPLMDVEDYLELDQNSKHILYEYLDGELRMQAGGSLDHSIVIANLTALIKGPLKGGRCRVYNSDAHWVCLTFREQVEGDRIEKNFSVVFSSLLRK